MRAEITLIFYHIHPLIACFLKSEFDLRDLCWFAGFEMKNAFPECLHGKKFLHHRMGGSDDDTACVLEQEV